ncbi:unnamed protein product [Parascedosporium putredinis]|uniref:Protein ZIP4 homolog n=1 Tax=Parascedosporium putredinis TaxID=1442378 RepID=A0A9P1MBE4_9PEZI|nr:unnamed protein product [Parascedosporium putredinis]CAI7999404.1 unnamed protein product [Parascedosporium putredinis]
MGNDTAVSRLQQDQGSDENLRHRELDHKDSSNGPRSADVGSKTGVVRPERTPRSGGRLIMHVSTAAVLNARSKSVAGSSVMDDAEQQPRRPSGPSASQQQQQQQQSQPQQEQRRRSSVPVPPAFDAPATSAPHPTSLDRRPRQGSDSFGEDVLGGASLHHLVQQSPHARLQGNPLNGGNLGQFAGGFHDTWLAAQSHLSGIPYGNYMIAPEVTDEFNLLDNFLHTSLLDDGGQLSEANSASIPNAPQSADLAAASAPAPRPSMTTPAGDDKARREYYLQAADPSGNATPEERMQRLLKAKYDAGLLKPFNYIKGYSRLGKYLDRNISAASKQKILRTLGQFRPKFRERASALTDMELVIVEMWFEKQLMEYDRVFASMAIPSTSPRSLHEILTEESCVRYWEEFQAIAFDPEHDSLLTACTLKIQDAKSDESMVIECSFSFVIKRDEHKLAGEARACSRELEPEAIHLWNLCTRLRREMDADVEGDDDQIAGPLSADVKASKRVLLLRCRALAFFVIDVARRHASFLPTGGDGGDGNGNGAACGCPSYGVADLLYLLRLALKAARSCVEAGEAELALACLQKGADYVRESWKEGRLDVAEHMYRKAGDVLKSLDVRLTENLCAVLFEIGRASLKQKDFVLATKWLGRAYEVIGGQSLEDLSRDGVELRLAILQALIQGLVGTGTPEDLGRARGLVTYAESEIGDKPVVLLMRLELLLSAPDEVFDALAYADLLRRMARGFNFTEPHFKFMVSNARRLYEKNAVLGCGVMDELLVGKLLGSGKAEWVEKALAVRVWMAMSRPSPSDDTVELGDLLARVRDGLEAPILPTTAATAQSLIWKQVQTTFEGKQWEMTDRWCRLAEHEIFHPAGPQNLVKISRKRILCALMQNRFEGAKQLYLSMPEPGRSELMTRYLAFKIALRTDDRELAVACIDALSGPSEQSCDFLYACVLDAHSVSSRRFAAAAMKGLVERYPTESSPRYQLHLPAMIRCTIRLLVNSSDISDGGGELEGASPEKVADDICHMFEKAASAIQDAPRDENDKKLFTIKELDWFHQNAYNIGVKRCEAWNLGYTMRIFQACLSIMKHYPPDIPQEDTKDLSLKAMCCHFIIVAALVSSARSEDVIDDRQRMYSRARRHVASFESELEKSGSATIQLVLSDLRSKLATLLVFDFESAVALEEWDDLAGVVRRADLCRDAIAYKAMADCLLEAAGAPAQAVFSTMRVVINQLWALEGLSLGKLAKYIRCLFQRVLPLEGSMAFQLAEEALRLAQEAVASTDRRFPDEELEWLAAVSWNHAMDLYSVGKDEECKKWAVKAINLAHYCGDDKRLEKLLQTRLGALKWEACSGS